MATTIEERRTLGDELRRTLKGKVRGEIVTAGDAGYDEARAVWNGSIDRSPAAVVRCHDADDVAAVIAEGRRRGLLIAVRGGGHNVAGLGTVDGGVVIDTGPMKDILVDPARRRAVAGAGVIGRELDAATQAHGLATTLGVMSTTGIAGLTLGGGIGWLQRKLGLTCDNLLAAELVTADGQRIRASEDEHAELLWGLRGGGGNFGVVTSFTYRLHDIGPDVFCGLTAWHAEDAAEVLEGLREFMADAPDEVMVVAVHRTAPPAPWLDESIHGQPILALAACYAGPAEDGQEALAELRGLGPEPIGDVFTTRPYADFQAMFDASWDPGFRNYWKAEYLTGLTDGIVDTFAEYAVAHTSPLSDFKVAAMGGAVARVPEGATACGHRDAAWVLNINTRWVDADEDARHIEHTRALFDACQPASTGGTYVNFLGAEGADRVRQAYRPETFERLQALKREWDPDNVFRLNQNIPPR